MIIDSHVHIGKTEKTNRYFTFDGYYILMKKYGVDESIVMPNLSSVIKTENLNKEFMKNLLDLSKSIDFCFYPFIIIDPREIETLNQISYFRDHIYGVKFHPSISETLITDYKMDIFMTNINVPVLVHCGRNRLSHISYLIQTAKRFKNINFIAAHMGGNATDLIEEAIQLISKEQLDNMWLDTSAGKLPWLIEEAVNKIGSEKILFGSDEPYSDTRIGIQCVELAEISDEDKEKIFYKNIKELLN